MIDMELSFYDWCVNNNRFDILCRWNYKLNGCSPEDISYRCRLHCYFDCPDNREHSPEQFRIDHITNNATKMDCKQCNSFYQWCIENNKQELIDAWDFDLNNVDIHYVPHASGKKYYFKIIDSLPDILYPLADITGKRQLSPIKKFYNSFGYYLINTFGDNAIDKYWSKKNIKSPWEYDRHSGQKVWFICQEKEYHDDYFMTIDHFVSGNRCPWCTGKKIHPLDSFAQYNINILGNDFLDKYWCDDNVVDPWAIRPFANDVVIKMQCQEKIYHQYRITAANFSLGHRCSFCGNNIVHPLDSLGTLFPKILDIWSDKNVKTPYEYHPNSHEFIWLKCSNGVHEDYQRRICDYTYHGFINCSKCIKEEMESYFQKTVRLFLEGYPYEILHEYDCSIIPVNPNTKMKMPFDNELCNVDGKNLIIEVHGSQHYELNGWHIERAKHTNRTPEEEFEYQKWKDVYKKEYAIINGYEYLEIPYWTILDGTYKDLIIYKINAMKHKYYKNA